MCWHAAEPMILRKSACFDAFRCIAAACPDSCCKEWEVEVDDTAAQRYLYAPGPLGDRLRQVMRREDGTWCLTITEGRCPMWREDGLCRIQAEWGEEALCHTCRAFPRLTHDHGDFREYTLELSCPAAARLILNAAPAPMVEETTPETAEPTYDPQDMAVLLRTRRKMLDILSDDTRPVGHSLALALLYGCQAQGELDGGEEAPFAVSAALSAAKEAANAGSAEDVLAFFQALEILTPQWRGRLVSPAEAPWQPVHLALARYFVERYWLQAISDGDLYARVKLAIISCLAVKLLGGDPIETAQLYSKEIENSARNIDAILDAAYTHSAFTDDKLLGWLLGT